MGCVQPLATGWNMEGWCSRFGTGKNFNPVCHADQFWGSISFLSDKVLSQMCKWFSANMLSLNLEKTNVIKSIKPHHDIH
jgi:hypothetical protein